MPRAAKHYRRLLPGASRLLCFSVLQRVRQSCKTSRKLRNRWVVEWEWIFQRKVMFTCRSRSAEFQMTYFFCGSGTAEIQVTVYCAKLRNFKSQIVLCAKAELLNFEINSIFLVRKRNFKSQDILCAEAELRDLKVKALVWKRNCETSSRTKFIVWKRNSVTSK